MKNLFCLFIILCATNAFAQTDTAIERLEKKLLVTEDISDKLDIINDLAEKTNFENQEKCQSYLDKGIYLAEQSRSREMMIKARRIAGLIYLTNGGLKARTLKAKDYINEALKIAKKEIGLTKEKIFCNGIMARIERTSGNALEALKYNNEAISLANETTDDSLKVISLLGLGNTQLVLDENLKGFKTYLEAQNIAEKSNHKNKDWLQISVYNSFVRFYSNIEDYDKAIDYQYKSLNYARQHKNTYDYLNGLFGIGGNYILAKKYDAAKSTFEELIRVADSIKDKDYRTQGVVGILNTIISSPDKKNGLSYLNQHPEIQTMFEKIGMMYQLEKGKGDIFHTLNMPDSSNYYYEKALPEFDKKASIFNRIDAYYNYGYHLFSTGNYNKALSYLLVSNKLADSTKNLSINVKILSTIDSTYQKIGDYKNAYYYGSLYKKIKDELDEKSKAKDVLALEIDAENKRKERLEKEEAEKTRVRHNWQYMGIVMAIISLFTLLATFGVFNVPLKWVRALGFIAFIFLFEFIILLADTWIHHATHGEPWKVLAIKVVLIALLLPLHHLLEHKAIQYITHRRNKKLGHDNLLSSLETKSLKIKKE